MRTWYDKIQDSFILFKYCKFYSGEEPEFIEGDMFRIVVPLNEEYSYDYGQEPDIHNATLKEEKVPIKYQ